MRDRTISLVPLNIGELSARVPIQEGVTCRFDLDFACCSLTSLPGHTLSVTSFGPWLEQKSFAGQTVLWHAGLPLLVFSYTGFTVLFCIARSISEGLLPPRTILEAYFQRTAYFNAFSVPYERWSSEVQGTGHLFSICPPFSTYRIATVVAAKYERRK
ncbi:hypothetical protein CLF_105645 [Clonorchis sinensis]|uniref:Uncharacterized protein n=1 Tax=Clonorchis sinensis TaxID=79923 RepID=G7YDW2_CLOSI|nr:hypothetical protein CLF_105645 [Clonorchis sinensis]